MKNIEVVGLGALNIDNIYKVERILEDGEAVVKESASSPGGSAANTIYGLAKLGIRAGFIGAIGDDTEGKALLWDFQKVGVDTSQIKVTPTAKTGSVLCLSDRLARRSLYVLPGANNRLTMKDMDLHYVNQVKILHISSFANDRQFKMLPKLIDRLDLSVKVSFSPGALFARKGLKALTPILARTYVLFMNEGEIEQLTSMDVIKGVETCLEQGCQIVVVTLGKGTSKEFAEFLGSEETVTAYIRHLNKTSFVPANVKDVVSVADTVGAGDAFATGFLYGLLKGKDIEECGHLGDIVAQFKIAKMGARPGLPTLDELAQRYQQLYRKQL